MLVGKREGHISLYRYRSRWGEDNTEMDLKKIRCLMIHLY